MSPGDADAIRRCIVRVSVMTRTGMDYLFNLPLDELSRLIQAIGKG